MSLGLIEKWRRDEKFCRAQDREMKCKDFWYLQKNYDNLINEVKSFKKISLITGEYRAGEYRVCIIKDKKIDYKTIYFLNTHDLSTEFTNSHSFERYMVRKIRIDDLDMLEQIDYFELQIGGTRMDRIYPDIFPKLRKLYNIKDKYILPFFLMIKGVQIFAYHEIRIHIKLKNDKSVHVAPRLSIELGTMNKMTYLRYRSDRSFLYKGKRQQKYPTQTYLFKVKMYQIEKETHDDISKNHEMFTNHDNSGRLFLYHPTYYLMCNKSIKDVELIINKKYIVSLSQEDGIFKLTPTCNIQYILESREYLQYGINFSLVDVVCIRYNYVNEKDKKSNAKDTFYTISRDTLRMMSGMAGCAWS